MSNKELSKSGRLFNMSMIGLKKKSIVSKRAASLGANFTQNKLKGEVDLLVSARGAYCFVTIFSFFKRTRTYVL